MENPGRVEFVLGKRHVRMEAFRADADKLWFIFKDTHPQTYKGGRFLNAPLHHDTMVTLDFNKAYNPPCAFTPYATCPLAPPENTLPFAVEAGEIAPAH
jgi:uncharacterized protein (DUF1684 family)